MDFIFDSTRQALHVSFSFRDLERSFGASHMTYKRAYEKIGQRMQEVEALAVARLTPYFEETGLTSGAAECA
ncbi:hypothetical protein ISI06_30175 [Burkholderia pseudomallei]|nr:hypothetical protein [Burkholderia pseudomallei]